LSFRAVVVLAALAALLSAPGLHAASPPQFDLLELGRAGGQISSGAQVINNRTQIAGVFDNADHHARPFVYWRGRVIPTGLPPGPYTYSHVTDINERGAVVGILRGDTDFDAAFIYEHGIMRGLSNALGYLIVNRIAINNSRTMVGTAQLEDQGKSFAFRYQHGVRTVLPSLIPDGNTYATALNNAGVAVGIAEFAPQTDPNVVNLHAAIFADDTVQDLGATIYQSLGIAPETRLGRDGFTRPVSTGTPLFDLFG
jgi:uncharacterized membrane protein